MAFNSLAKFVEEKEDELEKTGKEEVVESVTPNPLPTEKKARINSASGARTGSHPSSAEARTKQFRKAKSAATFTLDGISYTIGE